MSEEGLNTGTRLSEGKIVPKLQEAAFRGWVIYILGGSCLSF